MQNCTIVCNHKSAKRQETTIIGQGPGLKVTGSGKFKPPVPPPPPAATSDVAHRWHLLAHSIHVSLIRQQVRLFVASQVLFLIMCS